MTLPRIEPQSFHVWAGESVTLDVPVFDESGNPVTITGAMADFSVWWPESAAEKKLFQKTSAAGEITVSAQSVSVDLNSADTQTRFGDWPYFLSLATDDDESVVVWGTLTIGRRPASGG